MKKIIEYLTERVRRRPLCFASLIVTTIMILVVKTGLLQKGQPVYQPGACNVFEENGIPEGDSVLLVGKVKSLSVREVSGKPVLLALLSHVSTDEGVKITSSFSTIQSYFTVEDKLKIGQYVAFRGELSYFDRASNPGEFDSYEYYYNNDILFSIYNADIVKRGSSYSKTGQLMYEIRLAGEAVLEKTLNVEDAAIMKAMIFGNKSEISGDVRELFQKNGIAHILAISGLHISLIAMGLYGLLGKIGVNTPVRAFVSETVIILYGIMVGFPVSAFRAICMFSIFLAGKLILRSYDIMTSLSVAMTLVLFVHPNRLADAGLNLSFMAVAGLGFFYAGFEKNICKPHKWLSPFFISLFVFLSTLPILLCSYYEAAFYSVLLNLMIIPLMSLLMFAGIGLVLLGGIPWMYGIARVLTCIVSTILWAYKGTCAFLTERGMGRINLGRPGGWQIVFFYLLFGMAVAIRFDKKQKIGRYIHFTALVLLALTLLLVRPQSGMRIWMLDVGQGDCMVIRNDSGRVFIIDGGSTSRSDVGKKVIVPMLKYYGVNEIEAVFITHPDEDHMNGIRELLDLQKKECLKVKNIYVFEGFLENDEMRDIFDMAAADNIKLTGLAAGNHLRNGELDFGIIYPEKGHDTGNLNNASLVMKVTYGEFSMLTCGDVEAEGEGEIAEAENTGQRQSDTVDKQAGAGQDVGAENTGQGQSDTVGKPAGATDRGIDIIKIAHHGSKSSTSDAILEYMKPETALISVGRNNRYGHPNEAVIKRLNERNVRIIRTDESGAILVKVSKKGRTVRFTTFL